VRKEAKPDFEKAADDFAEDALIPVSLLDDFIVRKGPLFSESKIRGFANLHHVHPGVVLGQLQHREEVGYSTLRRLLVKVRDTAMQSALTDGWGSVVPQAKYQGNEVA
jgi:HTH-type transcriptional regulator/antitoxin HigA